MVRPLRIGLYCHNTFGLGHIMRSSRIAAALRATEGAADIRIITGCRALDKISLPDGVLIEELEPLDPKAFASNSAQPQINNRSRKITALIKTWQPDVLLVDLLTTGLGGELLPTLELIAKEGLATHLVLGVPYPERSPMTRPQWKRDKLAIDHYGTVIAYSDPAFFPVLDSYKDYIREAEQVYAGIITGPHPKMVGRTENGKPLVVVLNGGGGTSGILDETRSVLARVVEHDRAQLRIVGGVLRSWQQTGGLKFPENTEFVAEMTAETAVCDASVVVARCGYNTAFTLLRTPLPIVFLPEPQTSQEQLKRARAMAEIDDRIWCVDQQNTKNDGALAVALDAALTAPVADRELEIRLDGAERTADHLFARARKVRDQR